MSEVSACREANREIYSANAKEGSSRQTQSGQGNAIVSTSDRIGQTWKPAKEKKFITPIAEVFNLNVFCGQTTSDLCG